MSTCSMPAPLNAKIGASAAALAASRNVAVLEAVKFEASSTAESVMTRGPESAVEGASFWEAAAPPPGKFFLLLPPSLLGCVLASL